MKIEWNPQDEGDFGESIAEFLQKGTVGHGRMWEQEINFDAGYTPPREEWKNVRVEWIDGKKYNVYS